MDKVIIAGGGISGLISAIILARNGIPTIVFEKKNFPAQKVCGEYISNEVAPFLETLNLFPHSFNPPQISRFMLSSISGRSKTLSLDLGGFGISRYRFDEFLMQKARASGVEVVANTAVEDIKYTGEKFIVKTAKEEFETPLVLGAFGKRSNIDVKWNRRFTTQRSPYVGVKYHAHCDFPRDLVALHNFHGGYCGVGPIEDGKVNICYLVHREQLREYKAISSMESKLLFQNPQIKSVFSGANFLFEKAEVINEISFETKGPVENHVLMIGDAAGMITPLCGNGMAMAIHSAKIAGELAAKFMLEKKLNRDELENTYAKTWTKEFSQRLWVGRQVQKLFGSPLSSSIAINMTIFISPLAHFIMRNTHGKPF